MTPYTWLVGLVGVLIGWTLCCLVVIWVQERRR